MSTNQTTNYGLHAWEREDRFLLTEINENFAALDGANRVVFGTYTGDGETSRLIELGFTPKAVLVFPEDGRVSADGGYIFGGLAGPGAPVQSGSYQCLLIEETGFRAYRSQQYQYSYVRDLNSSSHTYYYLAIR